jgi:hypothetical protein
MLNQDEFGTNDSAASKPVQRINLVRFVSKQQEVYLSFKQILQLCSLVLIIFLGYRIYSFKEQLALNRHIAKLQLQKSELAKEMNSDRIRKMQDLMNSDTIRAVLHTNRSKNGLGFSSYLEEIATACPNGVWLTSININKHNNSTILSGKAYHPNNIIQLLGNLNNQSLFNNTPFFLANIEKTQEQITTDKKTTSKIVYSFIMQAQETAGSKT